MFSEFEVGDVVLAFHVARDAGFCSESWAVGASYLGLLGFFAGAEGDVPFFDPFAAAGAEDAVVAVGPQALSAIKALITEFTAEL